MIKTYKVHIRYPHLSISAITNHHHNPINSQNHQHLKSQLPQSHCWTVLIDHHNHLEVNG